MNNSVNRFALNVYQTAWLLNRFALGTPLAEVAGGLSRDTFEKAKDDVSTSKDSKPKASEVRFNNENGMGGGVSDANHDAIVKGTTLPVKTITLTSMDIVGEDMIPLNCKNVPDHPNLAENERRDDNAQADARNEVETEVDVDAEERIKKGYRDTSLDTISSESEGRTPKSSLTLSDRLYIGDIAKEVNSEEHSASSSKKCYCTNVEVHLAEAGTHRSLYSQHLSEGVFISMPDFELIPFFPEPALLLRISKLTCVDIETTRTIDFSELSLKTSISSTQNFRNSIRQILPDGCFVNVSDLAHAKRIHSS